MAFTTIDDPSVYFQTALYTGNGSSNAITNDGNSDLQADWIWLKERSSTSSHHVFDSTRGIGDSGKALLPDSTGAEGDDTAFRSFDSDGFTLASTNGFNQNTITNVAWQWKANGGSRTTFNASGNQLAGGYQANTTAGFSIVDYTGNATNGATFPHGLGATPVIAIIKDRANTGDGDGTNWIFVSTVEDTSSDRLYLNGTNTKYDLSGTETRADFDSSNVTLGTWNNVNASGAHIAYCFTPIQGYSKFGSYEGNGNADGPFIYTGFKPAWVLTKRTNATGDWVLLDNKRNTVNPLEKALKPNSNASENTGYWYLDFYSNGFKPKITEAEINGSTDNFIYMAFAESPFVSSEGIPTTAR